MADSKGRTIGYWVTTALLLLVLVGGGIMDAMAGPELLAQLGELGYPPYLARLLGVAKLAAAVTIAAPKLPRLKEWAYAGVAINMVGASYSHLSHGDPVANVVTPLVILAVALASYFLRPASRRLPDAP